MERSQPSTFRLTALVVTAVALLAPAAAQGADRAGQLRLESCKEAKPGGQCGTVAVPLDRSNPGAGTIDIFFAYFPHTGPDPASEAILITEGGPGASVTQDPFLTGFYHDTFKPLLKTRDLILLDQRGVGRSGAIDCPGIQHPKNGTDIYAAVSACGQQLGGAADLYGSDNVAQDIDAVRAALGLDKLDFYGGSAAAMDVEAYATRFPQHLRSAVLDSPLSTVGFDFFDADSPRQWYAAAQLICERSQSCAGGPVDAAADIAWAAQRLREKPLKGTARDERGKRRSVTVTEADFLWRMLGNDGGGNYLPAAEVPAAAHAFREGDPAPLLRLRAQNRGLIFGDEGKPTEFSVGDNFARFCTNMPSVPWDRSAPVTTRRQQWESAKAALPADYYAPFSADAWLAPLPTGPIGPDPCIEWPAPTHSPQPPIPPGSQLPGDVPALILTGDIDLSTPPAMAQRLNQAWPNSRLVTLKHAGHHTATPLGIRFECADGIIVDFIANLDPGKAGCAGKVFNALATVGEYPEKLRGAEAAKRAGGDHSNALDRKLATVAAATVVDGLRVTFVRGGAGRASGLRGGKVSSTDDETGIKIRLDDSRFARDVAVDGHAAYGFESERIGARLHVNGPGGEDGNLRVKGVWFPFFHKATSFKVVGTVHGRDVNLRVPAT